MSYLSLLVYDKRCEHYALSIGNNTISLLFEIIIIYEQSLSFRHLFRCLNDNFITDLPPHLVKNTHNITVSTAYSFLVAILLFLFLIKGNI